MAPLKLPPKKPKGAQSKGKGKQKQLHIDFASLDSARASAPADWNADEWLEEGTRQEEQGERYQVGAKAARHLQNATTCYRLAAALASPDSAFDARYNAARVLQTLGSDHLAPPDCVDALEGARTGYREALATLSTSDATARIDALFNLAQADATLLAYYEDGILPLVDELDRKRALAQEARELFAEVERLQRSELERYAAAANEDGDSLAGDDAQLPPSAENSSQETVRVTETTVVTPRLVIDTLLAAIGFDLQLSESSLSTAEDDAQLRQSAVEAFGRATELRAHIAAVAQDPAAYATASLAELDRDLSLQQAEMLAAWSPDEAGPRLEQLVAAAAPPRVIDVLSTHADHLVETFDRSEASPPETAESVLATALTAYDRAATLLSSRLSPPKHIPANQLAPLLSANLASQAHVHLLTYLVALRNGSSMASDSLHKAHRLALEAISAAKPAVILAAIPPAPTSGGSLPEIRAVTAQSSTGQQDARRDWSAVAAARNGFFTLVRVRYWGASGEPEGRERLRARVWGEWNAVGLGHGRTGAGAGEELKRREVAWWLDELEGDAVARVVGPEAAAAERQWWAALAP